MSGWFSVTRGLTSHHLFKGNPARLAIWMWLLDNAAWKDTTHDVKGKTVDVPRGSVCASERHIAQECGVGYQVVRTAIKRFTSEHMVNATPTHGKNLITLCNYEKYQDPKGGSNAAPNATLTQEQRNPNAQKEQGNKGTSKKEDTDVSLAVPAPANDLSVAVAIYNEAASDADWPQVQKLTPTRSKQLRSRLKDCGGVEGWRTAIDKATASDFLCGRNDRPWTGFGFDWMTKPANFIKIMEGNYDNRTHNTGTPNGPGHRPDAALENILRLTGAGQA